MLQKCKPVKNNNMANLSQRLESFQIAISGLVVLASRVSCGVPLSNNGDRCRSGCRRDRWRLCSSWQETFGRIPSPPFASIRTQATRN